MTALEAYALAKKIAISAVSGIKSLTVDGTTLKIETNDGNVIDMVFPTPADGRGITSTEINSQNHLIVTYDDNTIEDAGLIKGSDVEVNQLLSDGIKIATIKIGDNSTDLFAPEGSNCDYYIIDNSSNLPNDLTIEERKVYFCVNDIKFHIWNGTEWLIASAGGGITKYAELPDKPSINGITLEGNKTTADLGLDAANLVDGTTIVTDENGKLTIGEISTTDIDSLFS